MRLISIDRFQAEAGTAVKTTIPLDKRAGMCFKVVTSLFETALFTNTPGIVPIKMNHADRAFSAVTAEVIDGDLVITQAYSMVKDGMIYTVQYIEG